MRHTYFISTDGCINNLALILYSATRVWCFYIYNSFDFHKKIFTFADQFKKQTISKHVKSLSDIRKKAKGGKQCFAF